MVSDPLCSLVQNYYQTHSWHFPKDDPIFDHEVMVYANNKCDARYTTKERRKVYYENLLRHSLVTLLFGAASFGSILSLIGPDQGEEVDVIFRGALSLGILGGFAMLRCRDYFNCLDEKGKNQEANGL